MAKKFQEYTARATTATTLLRIAFALLFAVTMAACSRNPLATSLPLDVADIPKIQPQLDKLSSENRELVLAYLRRSKGDVLPAKFADPDEPLTARTFAEAIKLQREFNIKQAVVNARVDSLREARESGFEPLRKALSVELLKREILTADEVSGREPRQGQALNTTPTLVTTWRLLNASGDTITHFSGSVTVRTEADPTSLMGLARCYFNRSEPIPIGQAAEIRCGNPNTRAGDADKDFVSMPESSLLLTWEPETITLAGGKVMKAKD